MWGRINDCRNRIIKEVGHRMDMEHSRLRRLSERIPVLFSLARERQEARLERLETRMVSLMEDKLTQSRHHLIILCNSISPSVERIMTRERNRLGQLRLRAEALDPQLLLKRGYSITLFNGKAVHDASLLSEGDEIETRVEKGHIKSKVYGKRH